MNVQLLPHIMLLVPALFLFWMTAEIYSRNPGSALNRWTALTVFAFSCMIMGLFLEQTLPMELAPLFGRYFTYTAILVSLTASLYFVHLFTRSRVRPAVLHLLSLLPATGLGFLYSGSPRFGISVFPGPVWRTEVKSDGLDVLLLFFTLYSVVLYFIRMSQALRKLKSEPWLVGQRRRVRFFLAANAIALALTAVCQFILKPLGPDHPYLSYEVLSVYPVLIICWAMRYAMLHYGFLSSTGRRYEILFGKSPIGVSIFNDQGELLDANPAYLRLLGVANPSDCSSWKKKRIADFAAFDDGGDNISLMSQGFREKRSLQLKGVMVNRLDERFIVEKSIDYFEMEGQMLAFAIIQDVTGQTAYEQNLAFLAYHDPLTHLGNRRWFYENLAGELERLRRTEERLAVLLIDLDQFKWINDTLGHHAGDELLRSVAERLKEAVPAEAILARLGGDEFAVLIPNLSSECEAEGLAREVVAALRNPFPVSGRTFQVTASVGLSLAPKDGRDAEELMRNADSAMYSAKKAGRDGYGTFRPELIAESQRSLMLVNGLRTALEREEFTLQYQPQFDLQTGRTIGAEALIRWHSAEWGAVSPGEFIPAAEENGTIVPIGDWVLRSAIRQGKRWMEAGHAGLVVSVNVSARQLKDRQFAGRLAEILEEEQFPSCNLCLELTETSAIEDMEQSLHICREIVGLGVTLALDDFGIGYSSIGMLSQFPFHTIKIDKSLIRNIERNLNDVDIIQTIVKLSGNKGMKVLAEGVETEWQMELLRRFGCHAAQGYLLGRPMSADRFSERLSRHETKAEFRYQRYRGIEICGGAVMSFLNGAGRYRPVVLRFLEEGGFGRPEPNGWYPLPDFLAVLGGISEQLGTEALHRIGREIPETAVFPPDIGNLVGALASIDKAYYMNHRGVQTGQIGHYLFAATSDRSGVMVCDNPYPCDFDLGIIEAMAGKFKEPASQVRIVHDVNGCRKRNGSSCTYRIVW
ncbi:EAL domain-containing protein [Cohnella sp. CFH 77786]|uniref:sensor domain-containing protein n=1 Tax=Cohnella sp. CFH 77786 TaxID=2662265 RepID=UPI001C60F86A|nr:EAL domain-containing protein [Cohnella sp. CFH 77786]MBW5449307.1 EAL domain-containing protein [Cohnella sp. CFH 77786]